MIRQAEQSDVADILRVYAAARAFMRRTGNMTQWSGGYPPEDIIRADITKNILLLAGNQGGAYRRRLCPHPG